MHNKQLFTDSSPNCANVVQALNRVDWNFPRSGTHAASVHNLHWFPGNFIPQIPAFLIEILSTAGQTVCDPFAGSGTTGVEAGILRRNSVLLDANSAAVMIAHAKLALASYGCLVAALTAFGQQLAWQQNVTVPTRSRGSLEQWLHKNTLSQLETISHSISHEKNASARAVLDAVLSDTLFACSAPHNARTRTGGRRRHHWGWVADNVIPATPFAYDAVQLFLARLADAIDTATSGPRLGGYHAVVQSDARQLPLASDGVDIVVTSPPYLGMIDYARANRLTFAWHGWNLAVEMQNEIGARFKRGRRAVEPEYVSAMTAAAAEIARILKPGGYCAIVIGSSRRFPNMHQVVIDLFARGLTVVWGPVARIPTRRRVSERLGTDAVEFICVYRKIR